MAMVTMIKTKKNRIQRNAFYCGKSVLHHRLFPYSSVALSSKETIILFDSSAKMPPATALYSGEVKA